MPGFGVISEFVISDFGDTGHRISVDTGSFSFSGTATTLKIAHLASAGSGGFSFSGTAASLETGRKVSAGSGSFSFAGDDATLTHTTSARVIAESGSFNFSGAAAALAITAHVLGAESGSFTFSGTDASLEVGFRLDANAGSFSFSGTAVDLRTGRSVAAASGTFAFSGTAAGLSKGITLPLAGGSFAFSGTAAAFKTNRVVTATGGSFLFSGQAVSLVTSGELTLEPATYYIFLVEISGHDGSTLHDKYLSTEPFTDAPTNRQYEPRIIDPGSFRRGLGLDGNPFADSSPIIVASADPGNGETLDDWLDLGFGMRPITIRAVPRGVSQLSGNAVTVFHGTVQRVTSSAPLNRLEIDITDRLGKLELPLLGATTDRFAGTTVASAATAEGNADLKGQIKQRLWGSVANVAVQPANPYDLIYLVSNSALSSIALYDGGLALTLDGDSANITALRSATILPGHYRTCLSAGLVRVGATPDFDLTADVVEGANAAARTAAQIAYRMLIAYGIDVSEIDDVSFAALDAKNSAVVGEVVDDDRTALQAVTDVLKSIGARLVPDSAGKFQVFRIEAASAASADMTFDLEMQDINKTLELLDINVPVCKVVLEYNRVYHVQQGEAVLGAVTPERRATLASEYRAVTSPIDTSETDAILLQHLDAREVTITTNIASAVAAQAEADRIFALLKQALRQYRIKLSLADAFAADLGSSIGLVHDRLGMASGVDAFVFERNNLFKSQKIELTARV